MNAPNPVQVGSAISHWDAIAFPNQLMEPAINADLTHSVELPEDLSTELMADVGWFSDFDGVPDGQDLCLGSDPSLTVVIQGCDSGAPNTLFADGCKISDLLAACAVGAGNHGAYVSCVTQTTDALRNNGLLTGRQKGAIQSCATRCQHPLEASSRRP